MRLATTERSRGTGRLRAAALVALTSLACTTVRVPASGIPSAVTVRDNAAEPQLELWVESGKDVSPAEAAQATAEARGALEQALAGRRVAEGEQMLVVRAQGVSRTGSRRADQKAAVAGLVVGAVAVVAVAVVALVASKGKGGGKVPAIHAPSAARGARPAPAPSALAGSVRPAPVPGTRPAPPPFRPGPDHGHPHGNVSVGMQVFVQVPPEGAPPAAWSDSVVAGPGVEPGPRAQGELAGTVVLPPPPPLEVSRRGFFAGDSTRLELILVDRATGTPLWVKTVEGELDPRDAAAVRALLHGALDDPGGWSPAEAAR